MAVRRGEVILGFLPEWEYDVICGSLPSLVCWVQLHRVYMQATPLLQPGRACESGTMLMGLRQDLNVDLNVLSASLRLARANLLGA